MKTATFALAFATLLVATAASAQTTPFTLGKCGVDAITFSNIRVPQPVLADGKPLAADTYQVRIATERPTPAAGQSPSAECWIEFLKGGAVAGREVASVITAEDIGTIAKGPAPQLNQARVDVLKEGDYVRVWINSAGTNYLINNAGRAMSARLGVVRSSQQVVP